MRKFFKKALSIVLSLLVLVSSVLGVAAASSVSYPQEVTEKEALNAVNGTERLLKYILPSFSGGDLKALINNTLYTDEMLSDLLVNTYISLEQNSDAIEMLGVKIKVGYLSRALSDYPQVSAAVYKANSWSEVNLENVSWGVSDKYGFSAALGAIFSPFNDILYALLCDGNYEISKFIKIDGDNGYQNAIIPLYNSLFVSGYMTQAQFTASANENKNNMVKNIVLPLFTWLENITDTPVNSLTQTLPSFAYYVDSGKFNENFSLLLSPITSNPLVEIAVLLKILDLDSLSLDINALLASMTEGTGIVLGEIDFSALASCGKMTENGYKANKGLAYVQIMRYLIDILKLNGESIGELLGGEGDISFLTDLLKKDTDTLVGVIIHLFSKGKVGKPEAMVYPEFKAGSVEYTKNLDKDDIKRVYNQIDDLLDQFVKEGGQYSTMESLIKGSIYTGSNINELLKGVYGALEENGLTDVLKLVGIDCTPKGVAKLLTENKYQTAKNALSKADSWEKVSFKNVKWGFSDGSRNGFQNALTAVLRPLFPVLRALLAGEDMLLLDSIYITGADGYNTGVIPLLEALGCKNSSVKTYKAYKRSADGDGVIKNILNPVFDLLDELAKKPVKTAVRILPNAVYFIESGSLEKCISNLLLPITSIMNNLGLGDSLDVSSLTKELSIDSISKTLLDGLGMKIADFSIKDITSLGKKVEKESKAVIDGKNVKYSYIEADTTGVVMALLRVVAKTMRLPGNENLLMGTMGGGAASSFDISSINKELEGKSENEFIEWLVNLFFKERVKVEIVKDEEYNPTIIFTPEEMNYTPLYIFAGYLGVCLIVGIILFANRKKLYGNTEVD